MKQNDFIVTSHIRHCILKKILNTWSYIYKPTSNVEPLVGPNIVQSQRFSNWESKLCQDPCIVTFEFFMNNLMFSYRCKKNKKTYDVVSFYHRQGTQGGLWLLHNLSPCVTVRHIITYSTCFATVCTIRFTVASFWMKTFALNIQLLICIMENTDVRIRYIY